jgi:glycerol-3-phosphate dehydrogenase
MTASGRSEFDLLVVGGGCNGVGVARDAAMRGLSVCLLEKGDLGGGTTGRSSGMIHGGLRYLLSDLSVTRRSCLDSGYIQKIAPHLLFRIPFLYPVLKSRPFARTYLALAETYFEAYDRYQPLKNGKPHTRLTRAEALALEPALRPDILGAITMDEWGIDTYRLCAANALSAALHKAEIRVHHEVRGLLVSRGAVVGARVEDRTTRRLYDLRARVTVNAAGPWAARVAALAGCQARMRPAKGIHLITDRRLTNLAVICKAIDGRDVYVMPHENHSWIGTTDDDYFGNPDDVEATRDDVAYLLEAVERYLPGLKNARLISTMAGVRPTLYGEGIYEDDLSREHEVLDHAAREGVEGFISMIGGKLASYRIFAQEATDLVCRKLGLTATCKTHLEPLPGGEARPLPDRWSERFGISPHAARRLAFRQGALGEGILEAADESSCAVVCACEPVTEAELRHAIRHEWARSLEDLRHRTRLGMGPCQGARCAVRALAVLAQETGMTAREALEDFWRFEARLWRERRAILAGDQLAQEELSRGIHLGVGRLHELVPPPEEP